MRIKVPAIFLFLIFTACNSPSIRIENADSLARSNGFTKNIVGTSLFNILTYVKFSDINQPVTYYVEGDGLAYIDRYRVALNPTPTDPVSLRLAILDPSANVIYIARPCQFVPHEQNPGCNQAFWTNKRYAPEVISSISEVIDFYIKTNKLNNIRLVGFSGGATVAAILAAQRDDILDLRTVAGNLDINAFIKFHNASPLTGSLNPVDYADRLKDIPQYHITGEDDDIVPAVVIDSYVAEIRKRDPDLNCIFTETVPGVSHTQGWEKIWNQIVNRLITCR